MSDELTDLFVAELGFERKPPSRPGLQRAISAFLGPHLEQKTPIQEQAIEVIYDGADVLLISATASGKTEAAMIPIAARLLGQPDRPVALYVAPTRALLNDLHRRLEAPLRQLGLEARIRHGDRALPEDTSHIRVLFTTPESLDVLLSKNTSLLKQVRYAVVDEVHQIFGTPRGDQLAFLLQRLEHFAGHRVQRLALSATVGNPGEIAGWLCPQHEPARVISAAGGRRIIANLHWMSELSMLCDLLRSSQYDKILCFVNSRRRCDDIYLLLRDLQPHESFVHYSTLTKEQREYVERGFKSAQMAICVATTTLELGIDIGSIQEVILVDAPTTVNSFLQRIGRGGRRGQYTYVTVIPQNPLELLQFATMLRLAENGQVEGQTAGQPYSVSIQQIFSILAGKRRLCLHPDELTEQFGVFPWLAAEQIHATLDRLVDQEFLRREPGQRIYQVGSKLEDLIEGREIYTNISAQDAGTPVFHSGRLLASLPLSPNHIRHGNVILFAGRFWRITGISDRGLTVDLVHPVTNPVRPVWGSRGAFAASSLLAHGMHDLLLSQPTLSDHQIDKECARQLEMLYHRTAGLQTTKGAVWQERVGDRYMYYTFAGATENQIVRLLFEENGLRCEPAARAEGIALISGEPLDFDCLPHDPGRIAATVATHWRRFTNWISTGPYFELLPPALRRDETVAQIANSAVVETVAGLSRASVVPVDLQLVR
ncbi:MAG: DEAD/DEAH box helicase [Anaerolineae bacterium]|nr:DEAD/DEAH box helicase [Anaerolineae bacterium]